MHDESDEDAHVGRSDKTAGARKRIWRRIRLSIVFATALVVLGGAAAFGIGYLVWPIPDPREIADKTKQSVLIKYSNNTEMTRIVPSSGHRIMVEDLREDVSKSMREATLAAEDASFYHNRGFDVAGILRAAWSQVTGGAGGGSTLTQQYVKLATGADEFSYFRKFKEVVLAFKMTNERPKDEILKAYLNTAYYGRGAYGIHAAAEAYFGKLPKDLNPSESALLAGMVQRPTENDPAYNPQQGRARWNYVAGQMRQHNFVNAWESSQMRLPQTRERFAWKGEKTTGSIYHIRQKVLEEVERAGLTEADLQRNGYTVITNIDAAAQQAAEDAVSAVTQGQPPNLRTALVAIEPSTGAVRAYHSGDAPVGGYDWASAPQYPGSAFDPFVSLAAMKACVDGGGDRGTTVGCQDSARIDELANRMDPALIRETAVRIGFSGHVDGKPAFSGPDGVSRERIIKGEYPVSTMDMAHAYATLADEGRDRQPRFVHKVVDKDGHEVVSFGSEPKPAFSEDAARSAAVARGLTSGLWSSPEPAAVVRTGNYYSMTAWTNGYTPRMSVSVSLSASDEKNLPQPLRDAVGRPIDGTSFTGSIWSRFTFPYLQDSPMDRRPGAAMPLPDQASLGCAPSDPSCDRRNPF